MVALTVDLEMSWSSSWTVPVTFVNSPWTLEMQRWRTENWALEWAGSSCQVVDWAEAVIVARISAKPNAIRNFFMVLSRVNLVLKLFKFVTSEIIAGAGVLPQRRGERRNSPTRNGRGKPRLDRFVAGRWASAKAAALQPQCNRGLRTSKPPHSILS